MKELALIVVPLAAAALALVWPTDRLRPWLLVAAGLGHAALALSMLVKPPELVPGAWLAFDPLARSVLPAISLLFLVCSAYGVAYLGLRSERRNRVFVGMFLTLLGLLRNKIGRAHV